MRFLFLFLACFALYGSSVLVESGVPEDRYDWFVSYAPGSPFGVEKQVIVINNQFPGPLLNMTTNDVVHVNLHNNLDEPFLMTWNGVQMRKNSWYDGVEGTTCPIPPGKNFTYSFQVKDQIGSFAYFPSLHLQKAAGGYGPIRINNRAVVPIPFDFPYEDHDIMIGDWYNAGHKALRAVLDGGNTLPSPDGILINGMPPFKLNIHFEPGAEVRRLGLTLKEDSSMMKAVNAEARPLQGVAKEVRIAVENWSGVANFTVTSLDDFKVILGMDFLIAAKAIPMPHLGVVGFMEEGSSCMVKAVRGKLSKGEAISATQLKKGGKRGTAYLAVLEKKESFEEEGLSLETKGHSEKSLPRREVDRAIGMGTSAKKYVVDCVEAKATKWSGSRKESLKACKGRSGRQSCNRTRMRRGVSDHVQPRYERDRRLDSLHEAHLVPRRAHTKARVGMANQFAFDLEEKMDKS